MNSMRGFQKLASLSILGAFLAFIGLQGFHHHAGAVPQRSDCQVCQAVHQTPALIQASIALPHPVAVTETNPLKAIQTPSLLVFVSHGLAPPLA